MICKVFKTSLGWSNCLYIFPSVITWKDIKSYSFTKNINKEDYIGEFEFDKNFLSYLNHKKINNKEFWFEFLYESTLDEDEEIEYDEIF
jgi:hypothetical protein